MRGGHTMSCLTCLPSLVGTPSRQSMASASSGWRSVGVCVPGPGVGLWVGRGGEWGVAAPGSRVSLLVRVSISGCGGKLEDVTV